MLEEKGQRSVRKFLQHEFLILYIFQEENLWSQSTVVRFQSTRETVEWWSSKFILNFVTDFSVKSQEIYP